MRFSPSLRLLDTRPLSYCAPPRAATTRCTATAAGHPGKNVTCLKKTAYASKPMNRLGKKETLAALGLSADFAAAGDRAHPVSANRRKNSTSNDVTTCAPAGQFFRAQRRRGNKPAKAAGACHEPYGAQADRAVARRFLPGQNLSLLGRSKLRPPLRKTLVETVVIKR